MLASVLAATAVFAALPALAVHPLVRACVRRRGAWPLSLATGLAAWLVVFSLVAREIPGYLLTLPLSFVVFLGLVAGGLVWVARRAGEPVAGSPDAGGNVASRVKRLLGVAFTPSREGLALGAVFLCLFAGLLALRSSFSQIFFDPGRFGAEKLYNVQFIQSFLFADTWPPESPWYAGSPTGYYVLPKAIPGLVEHVLHHVFGLKGTAGVLFHVSDAFFMATAVVVLMSVLHGVFSRKAPGWRPLAAAVALGLLPLLGAPARALSQAFRSKVDLWALTRIVENTINEYPFWNYLWADNHSHSSALFVQFAFVGWFLEFLRARARLVPATLAATLASALVLSHSGSVFIDLLLCGSFAVVALWHAFARKEIIPLLRDFAVLGAVALVLTLPDLATRGQPGVRWYFVSAEYSTGLLDFLNIYFTHGVAFLALAGFALVALGRERVEIPRAQVTELFVSILGAVFLAVLGRASWGLAFLIFNALRIVSFLSTRIGAVPGVDAADSLPDPGEAGIAEDTLRCGACVALFVLLLAPEVVASNFDMGDKYMRYNTLFRFLFESYALVPLLLALALGAPLMAALSRKGTAVAAGVVAVSLLAMFGFVQARTAEKRIASVPAAGGVAGLDGLAWFAKERPGDAAIVRWLLDEPRMDIRIVEECAIAPKPSAYSVLSRLSALSGRPALCGWVNHVLLFQKRVLHPDYSGKSTWENLQERETWIAGLYGLSELTPAARKGLRDFGVTHVAFGEAEKEHHPSLTLDALGKYGAIVFRQGDYGLVELAPLTP